MSFKRFIIALPVLPLLAGCVAPVTGHPAISADGGGSYVNSGYRSGQVELPRVKVPSLADMQDLQASPKSAGATDADRLRAPALRDAALSYGARGGLAWSSKQINDILEARAPDLTRTYDFNRLLIKANGGFTVLPPVISESRDTYEQFDAGKTLRVADRYYEIVEQARFSPTAPLWHTYLIRSYSTPERPQDALLPKNDGERDLWRKFVAEGWEKGVEQSQTIFKKDMERLSRDFDGMVRYSELLEKRQVTAPIVSTANLGTTGTGADMREGDRAARITMDPHLMVGGVKNWRAAVSAPESPVEAATPPGGHPGGNRIDGRPVAPRTPMPLTLPPSPGILPERMTPTIPPGQPLPPPTSTSSTSY